MFPLTGRLHVHVTDRLVYRLWVLEGFPNAHLLCYTVLVLRECGLISRDGQLLLHMGGTLAMVEEEESACGP